MKAIERLSDIGQVYEGETLVGDYPYRITVYQEMVGGPQEQIPGLKSIRGSIDMDFDTIMRLMHGDENLRLQLKDGRKLYFFFSRNDGTISAKGALA